LLEERRGPSLSPEPSPDSSLDPLLRLSGTNSSLLLLPTPLPLDPFLFPVPLVLSLDLLLRLNGTNSS